MKVNTLQVVSELVVLVLYCCITDHLKTKWLKSVLPLRVLELIDWFYLDGSLLGAIMHLQSVSGSRVISKDFWVTGLQLILADCWVFSRTLLGGLHFLKHSTWFLKASIPKETRLKLYLLVWPGLGSRTFPLQSHAWLNSKATYQIVSIHMMGDFVVVILKAMIWLSAS